MCDMLGEHVYLQKEVFPTMTVSGLQKLTLLDYPGKVACTVFTAGCDLRCPFCHNASLVLPERERDVVSEDELFAFLRKRQGLLDGVAVTGGEPLLHRGLPELLKKIRDLGFSVKLDTNGTFPEALRNVVEAGLADRIAMDIKNSPSKYAVTVGIPDFDLSPVKESAAFLMESGAEYEFRTTAAVGLHEASDFVEIGKWIAGAEEYYLQDFKDSGDLINGNGLSAFSAEEMETLAAAVRPYVPAVKIRGV